LIYAQKGKLVTFGVVPNAPSTAYGYIESQEPLSEKLYKGSCICSFIEKPNFDKAKILNTNKRFS